MAALRRTLDRVPEVMVKVTGGGRDSGTAEAHIDYIDRHGELDVLTDDGDTLKGRDVSGFLVKDWKLETVINQRHRDAPEPGEKDKRAKLVHNIVLSMPHGAPPQKVLEAAQFFARENFAFSHRYAMVLHDPATDPKHEKTESGKNPHVHLVVKAVSETGERLYIRKNTLQDWREQFAQALRDRGVEANATPAAIRGKGRSSMKGAMHQHQERLAKWQSNPEANKKPIESSYLKGQVESALNEVVNGVVSDMTGKAVLEGTRNNVVADWNATAHALRAAGMDNDAKAVEAFIKTLPAVKTDYEVLRDRVAKDTGRLQAALGQKPKATQVELKPAVDKQTQDVDYLAPGR
ncbi:hypothetical protein BJL95_13035 [Methylomonas sp. LWB]|nr:hypothetical protein BJL95_13035 [Methylomonas sp. LWB]